MNIDITFDRDGFVADQRAFGNACRTAEGKADNFGRSALTALVTSSLTPLALAISVYAEMEPKKSNGKPAEPKESEKAASGVSVSSLRSAKGGEAARSVIEALFYVYENRDYDAEAVADYILNKRGAFKLFPLKRHIQAMKAKAAKEEAEANGTAEAEEPKEGMEEEAASTPLTEAIAFIGQLQGDELAKHGDDIAALLEACRDAADRLAAADTLRTGTEG